MAKFLPARRAGALATVLCVLGMGLAGAAPAETSPAGKTGTTHDQLLEECGRPDPFAPLMRRPAAKLPQQAEGEYLPPAEDREETGGQLRLAGIIWSKSRPQAIINDTLVALGDKVAGRTVLGIERNRVVLEINSGKEILKIETPSLVEVTGQTPTGGKRNDARKNK